MGEICVVETEPKLTRCERVELGMAIRPGDLVRTKPKERELSEQWQPEPIQRRGENWVSGPLAFDEV